MLNEIPLDEVPEVFTINTQVRELEGADRHLQEMLTAAAAATAATAAAAAIAGDVGASQGDDGGAGMGNASGQALL